MKVLKDQVWRDNDTRSGGKEVIVLRVYEKLGIEYAEVQSIPIKTPKRSVKTRRMGVGPKGGKLAYSFVRGPTE
jgi:hypothetical protein